MPFDGDAIGSNTTTDLYGCLKQFYLLKKKNRNLKVLLTIGGYGAAKAFSHIAFTPLGRATFAASALTLVQNLGFDRVDINWQYPKNDNDAGNYVLLLQAIRATFDEYSCSLPSQYHFELTATGPAGPSDYKFMHLAEMDQYLDFWNVIACAFYEPWSEITSHQSNIFISANITSTPFNAFTAISTYLSKGVHPSKIVLGMPLYGWIFDGSAGLGTPFAASSNKIEYKQLPLPGATVTYDHQTGASYSYDLEKMQFISYDNIVVATQKALWIQQLGLGGAMWWQASSDASGARSLIGAVARILGGSNGSLFENSPNLLDYPHTSFANLKAGMPPNKTLLSNISAFLWQNVSTATSKASPSTNITWAGIVSSSIVSIRPTLSFVII